MQTTPSQPVAHICVGRNRQRVYGDNSIYLEDGQEFTIELYNPTSNNVGARITINGDAISSSLIVIRPAQRYYLERFIDSPRKLKFSTYVAEGDAETVRRATMSNGIVRVEFFNEIHQQVTTGGTTWYPYPYNGIWFGSTNTVNTGTGTVRNFKLTTSDFNSASCYSYCADAGASGGAKSVEVETGRVEHGSSSDQSFGTHYGSFSSLPISTSQYKILPVSQKPVEAGQIREFCGKCNSRRKKTSWKFCPSCGTKY